MRYCYVELSKSNRSICKVCRKRINKNLPRMVYVDYGSNFSCYNCYLKYLKLKTKELRDRIKQADESKVIMKQLIKKHSKEIVMDKLR